MPDVNMPGGELFVRQMLYGKGYFREKLGVDVTVGWQLDTFGHHPQMPQLMKLGGYKSFWIAARPEGRQNALRVPLARDRRLANPHVLAAAKLRC